jgi:DNA-binding transcriptional LysR family regulator
VRQSGSVRGAVSLDLLRTFLAVYRAGTLTGAAAELGLAQPTVTTQLRTLEATLGEPLFVRHPRGVLATAGAHDLARQLDGPLDALAGVASGLAGGTGLDGRTLRLGAPAELLSARVLPALRSTVHAGVALRCRLGVAEDLLAELATGGLDLVVSTIRPRRSGLHSEAVFDEEFRLVAAPALASRLNTALLAADPAKALQQLPVLAWAEELPIIRRWWRHVLGAPPAFRAAVVVPDLRALLTAAEAGLGATVLPHYLCDDALTAGRLVQLHATDDPPINTLYLATRTAARTQPHVAHAWSALARHAASW